MGKVLLDAQHDTQPVYGVPKYFPLGPGGSLHLSPPPARLKGGPRRRLIYWKMHNELMQAASVKPDTLLFVKAQLGWSSFAVHFWKNRQERRRSF